MSTSSIYVRIDISGILLIFSKTLEEINMDSEKVIIEIMKPLLKDYLTFTKGEVPKDWVNVRDERQNEVTRKSEEVKKLNEKINKAIAYNEKAKALIPELSTMDPNLCEQMQDNVKENEEKLADYRNQCNNTKVELAQAEYELKQAQAQIETRRQAKLEKIRHEIHTQMEQYVKEKREEIEPILKEKRNKLEEMKAIYHSARTEEKVVYKLRREMKKQKELQGAEAYKVIYTAIDEKVRSQIDELIRRKSAVNQAKREVEQEQAKLDELNSYTNIGEGELQYLVDIVENQEREELRRVKIDEIKLALAQKEKTCEDLLTPEYADIKAGYVRKLENASIEEIEKEQEKMETMTIARMYNKACKKALDEKNAKKAKDIFATMQKIEQREQEQIEKTKVQETVEYANENEAQSKKGNVFSNFVQATKTIVKNIRGMFRNGLNRYLGIDLLEAGKGTVIKSDEEINETWQKNVEKREQQIRDIARQKKQEEQRQQQDSGSLQEEMSQEDIQKKVVLSAEEERKKQVQETNPNKEIDYVGMAIQGAQEVATKAKNEQIRRWEATRRAIGRDENARKEIVEQAAQRSEQRAKQKEEERQAIIQEKQDWEIPEFLKSERKQKMNAYKEELNAGLSQEEQRRTAMGFFHRKKGKEKDKSYEVLLGGE